MASPDSPRSSPTVLIIEDESDLISTLAYNLEREGYRVRTAACGEDGWRAVKAQPTPDLVLLDLMLPDIPGTEVCRRIRADGATQSTPVIMLTARGEEIDRVVGFEVGADDYVVKPFSVRELMLRVRAVLKRKPRQAPTPDHVSFGCLRIDHARHRVSIRDEAVELTALEFRLLTVLVSRAGRVQTREQLLRDVWGITADVTTRTVDTHVKRLRTKIGEAAAYVETIRGVGYRWVESPREADLESGRPG